MMLHSLYPEHMLLLCVVRGNLYTGPGQLQGGFTTPCLFGGSFCRLLVLEECEATQFRRAKDLETENKLISTVISD